MKSAMLVGALWLVCSVSTSLGQFLCNAYPNSTQSQEFVTTGGSVPEGSPCCFPFVYNRQLYNECTMSGHGRMWCAVDSVYRESNKRWGNCQQVPTPAPSPFICRSVVSEEFVTRGGSVPAGTPCCFPFVYKGLLFSSCTGMDHNQAWCSVESVYQEFNKRWGNCEQMATLAPPMSGCNAPSMQSQEFMTYGGTAPLRTPCCFPFSYKGQTINGCTMLDYNQAWCAIDNVYESRELWGSCQQMPGAAAPQSPFSCNAFPESATSRDFYTRGGSVAAGTPCCFPFVYRSQMFYQCTTMDHRQLWCGVESVFQENNQLWGNCEAAAATPPPEVAYNCNLPSLRSQDFVTTLGSVAQGTPCCFPFVFENQVYSQCTTKDHGQPWCAVENFYNEANKLWGNCQRATAVVTPAPSSAMCGVFGNSSLSQEFFTFGGSVPQGTPCCFPFVYNAEIYHTCTGVGHFRAWCATVSVYSESNKQWGNCRQVATPAPPIAPPASPFNCNAFANSTRSAEFITRDGTAPRGTPCCFPFVFQGVTYNECTSAGHTRLWCAIESMYNEANKLWGNCDRVATPAPPVATSDQACDAFANSTRSQEFVTTGGTVPEGSGCCFPFIYKEQAYNGCTNRDHTRLWCTTMNVYNPNNKIWGNCRQVATPAPTMAPTGTCNAFTNSTQSQMFVTTGGTVPAGTPCCFPFIYRAVTYQTCTTVNNPQPWCAIESYYNEDTMLWGNCVAQTPAVQPTPTPMPTPTPTPTPTPAPPAGGLFGGK